MSETVNTSSTISQNTTEQILQHDDSAVLKHVEVYQAIITRMAANSAACKQWCILLVSAMLAFVVEKSRPDLALLSLMPIIAFGFLDIYYLGLEKQFREAFNESMTKLRAECFTVDDLFTIKATGKVPASRHTIMALCSWSTWPVYIGLLLVMLVAAFSV